MPTPCGPCKKPVLASANHVAWEVFQEMSSQARVAGLGGVIGFDYQSLPFVFGIHQIGSEHWYETYLKLLRVWAVAMKHWNKKEEKSK
jgi:Phage related hypothetical protein (DUF1799)